MNRNLRNAIASEVGAALLNYGIRRTRKAFNNKNKQPPVAAPAAAAPKRKRPQRTGGRVVKRGGPNKLKNVSAPTANTSIMRRMRTSIDNMVFNHSELLLPLFGSDEYYCNYVPINPGLNTTVPWLSQIAGLWDMYNVEAMRFRFIPACATTTPGTVMLGFDYDVLDSVPSSKSAFMMLQDSCVGPSWAECDIALPRQSLSRRKNLFVRAGGLPANADAKTYDLGQVFIATQGNGNTFIGDVYIDYAIRLSMPQQIAEPVMSYCIANAYHGGFTGQTNARPFGTLTASAEQAKNPPGYLTYGANNEFRFQRPGSYIVSLYGTGTGLTVNFNYITINDTDFPSDTVANIYATVSSGSTIGMITSQMNVSDGNTLQIIWTGFTTLTEVVLIITLADSSVDYVN